MVKFWMITPARRYPCGALISTAEYVPLGSKSAVVCAHPFSSVVSFVTT